MKSLTLAAGIGVMVLPLTAGQAGILTLGHGFARSCYEASQSQTWTPDAIETCNLAFSEQGLDVRDQVATHVNRGIVYFVSGNLAAANYDYDQAIALDPNEPEAWLNKGMAALRAGNSGAAVPMFEKALALKTVRPAFAYYGRGVANENNGDFRRAYSDFQRARELEPRWSLPAKELKRYAVRN